jgi:hypothetical protein
MYRRNKQEQVVGVLNDFELSIFHLDDSEFSKERTGTVPYTVLFRSTIRHAGIVYLAAARGRQCR